MFRFSMIMFGLVTVFMMAKENLLINEIDLKNGTAQISDVKKIEAEITDVPIIIVESDVSKITVTSTVENTGIGIITQPKFWEKGDVLHFHQGHQIGYRTESKGKVMIEIPKGTNLDIDIASGSGDVKVDTSSSDYVSIDAEVGEKTVNTNGKELLIKSVSGSINIHGSFESTQIDTVNSDVKMFADAGANAIYYKSISGNALICAEGVKGCNLQYKYAGGKVNEFIELEKTLEKTLDIGGDTVDGHIKVVSSDAVEF